MDNINAFKAAVTAILAAMTALWGWFGWVVVAWIGSMAIDYLTGSAAALRAGKWSSHAARDGIWHKVGAIVAVVVAAILDLVIGTMIANIPNINDVEPMTHALDDFCYVLRDDVAGESVPITDLLKNCDNYEDREIVAPKVVD